jgi:hypothetical protein
LTPNASAIATPEHDLKKPTQQRSDACVPADEEKKPEEKFSASGDDPDRRDLSDDPAYAGARAWPPCLEDHQQLLVFGGRIVEELRLDLRAVLGGADGARAAS